MRTSRLLTAALGVLLATTTVALTGTAATAGDNDREDWSGQRALRTGEGESQPIRLLTTQSRNNGWALLARRISDPSATPDIWRLREYSGTAKTGLAWRNPARAPKDVTSFRSAQDRWGRTATAWIHDGGLWAGTKTTWSRAPMAVTRLADEVPGAGAPQVLMPAFGEGFIIEYAGTWHEYNPGPLDSCNGCDHPYQRWYHRAAPAAPAGAPADYTRILRHDTGWLMAFWTGDTGSPGDGALRSAERLPSPDGPVWSEPEVIAEGHEFVAFAATALGYRLVTLDPAGRVNLFDYAETTYGAPGAFTNQRVVSDRTDGSLPRVLVDREGVLTLAWRDADRESGMFVRQEDRPGSTYLDQPTLVPGTQRSLAATVVTAPYGTLTVAYQSDRQRRGTWQTRVVHLPTGTSRWTDPARLTSPKPAHGRGVFSVGQPRITGDVWVAANDDNGAWVHRFDAPKPGSKITRPTRTTQPDPTYTLRWRVTWAYASDYEVRARTGKRSGWEDVAVPHGARSKTVTRPRGETRCYQVRGILPSYGMRTDWSKSRCLTVRR
jgi:hypothetical protein